MLDGFSLTVETGRIVTIIGASGADKTTIVDLLLGFHRPQGGEILVDGADDVCELPSRQAAERVEAG